jgi:hypothetical protein
MHAELTASAELVEDEEVEVLECPIWLFYSFV